MKPAVPVLALTILAYAAYGQAAAKFDVASIKMSGPGESERSLTHNAGARLTTSNATLKMLILLAYQVMPYQLSGGPSWLESDGFDIEAKAANPKATQAQFRQMLQGLLADRFQLKVHMATAELPVYMLVAAKGGAKLAEAKQANPEVSVKIDGPGHMTAIKATMPMLTNALTRPLQRKVVDQTGLVGAYNFELRYLPDPKPPRPGDDAAPPIGNGPSLFTALQEQLGLSLKAGRGPVEVLVIDHAERPSAN